MNNQFLTAATAEGLSDQEIKAALKASLDSLGELKKVLIIPPDITRLNAHAGPITCMLWDLLPDAEIDIMPALGTHMPMTKEEVDFMFPGLPFERFLEHDWRNDIVKIGEVPADFVSEVSEERMQQSIDVELNKRILDPSYDLIISVGQVVPL
jgi:nickel-dependent lactate racemase